MPAHQPQPCSGTQSARQQVRSASAAQARQARAAPTVAVAVLVLLLGEPRPQQAADADRIAPLGVQLQLLDQHLR
jgi:hypothetical protein